MKWTKHNQSNKIGSIEFQDIRAFDKFLQSAQKEISYSKRLLENAAVTRRFWSKVTNVFVKITKKMNEN